MTQEERLIQKDRMRFIKNKLPANLALFAILFDVFYFVSIYQSDVRDYYYTMMIGGSILYNLVFMLACFLASEGLKKVGRVMGDSQYAFVVGCLILSAVCCLAAAVIGGVRSKVLKQYLASLETKSA